MSDLKLPSHDGRYVFTINDFAAVFKIGRTTIYELIKAKKLIARKIGSRTVITRDDAINWLKSLPVSAQ
jgi:excisionase family DNA binding protein